MHIKDSDIDPGLRTAGRLFRPLLPTQTRFSARLANQLTKAIIGVNHTKMNYEQHYLERGDGSYLRICVYYGQNLKPNAPGLLWIHGGGYAIGAPEAETGEFQELVEKGNAVVVAPDYRRSVQQPYPAALDDCYLALRWFKQHAKDYEVRAEQLAVGGISAGGGLTAALSLYARDKGEVAIAFQMPLYPMIDDRLTTSSTDNDAPVWNSKSNLNSWKMYLGSLYGSNQIPGYAVPARANDFGHLPPTISYVGSIEPFRDETINYINDLKLAGVPTFFREFPKSFHAFDWLVPNAKISKEAHAFLLDRFKYCVEHYFVK